MHCNDVNCAGNDESLVTQVPIGIFEATHVLAAGDLPVVAFAGACCDGSASTGLRVLRCANTNCSTLSNDPTFIVLRGNNAQFSIVLDASGFPVVSYNESGAGLKVLHCNDANCVGGDESVTTLDPTQNNKFTSMALVNGNPVIAYTSGSGPPDITVARCDDPNCTGGGETIEVLTNDCCQNRGSAAIAIDASGNPVVAYYRGGGLGTHVIHCNDAACAGGDDSDFAAITTGGNATHAQRSPVASARWQRTADPVDIRQRRWCTQPRHPALW
jgi:hypothetical protein